MTVVFFYGPMGAGKTERLIAEINKNGDKRKIVIKSKIDDRAGEKYISTHNYLSDPIKYADEKIEATYVTEKLETLVTNVSFIEDIAMYTRSIYIDEGQFFPDLDGFIIRMRGEADIYVATLEKDWEKNYFSSIEKSFQLKYVEKIQLYAKCDMCNERTAVYCYKKDEEKVVDGFLVGGTDIYGSICHNCDKR